MSTSPVSGSQPFEDLCSQAVSDIEFFDKNHNSQSLMDSEDLVNLIVSQEKEIGIENNQMEVDRSLNFDPETEPTQMDIQSTPSDIVIEKIQTVAKPYEIEPSMSMVQIHPGGQSIFDIASPPAASSSDHNRRDPVFAVAGSNDLVLDRMQVLVTLNKAILTQDSSGFSTPSGHQHLFDEPGKLCLFLCLFIFN